MGLCLHSWRQERRVVVLRRQLASPPELDDYGQAQLPELNLELGGIWYEHAVLVTNWEEPDLEVIAQVYRDRAATENVFDDLKNQWGWTGFSTADLKRSQLMARIVALIFNWWKLYLRMTLGPENGEADQACGSEQAEVGERAWKGLEACALTGSDQ